MSCHYFLCSVSPMMLRELAAFEACWLDLKDTYPTNRQDNTLIAHAMGQLVDGLAKPAQVEQTIPHHLKTLFRQLAMAYFQGYRPQMPSPTNLSPGDRQDVEMDTHAVDISAAVDRVRLLAQQSRSRLGTLCDTQGCSFAEMETLVIEFPPP
jgi:hypothetical protein